MINKKYPRGSEWRKWDLHVHSPFSVLYNEFPGTSVDEKWNHYVAALEKITDVAVLGITDYFSIEGYKKAIVDKSSGRLSNFDLILPNVELRLDVTTQQDKPVNIHIIFSPTIVPDLEGRFFSRLTFSYRNQSYAATRRDLINLGRTFLSDISVSDEKALRSGMEQYKVSKSDLVNLFNDDALLRNNSFVIIADRSGDGASGVKDNSLKALREELYRFSDAIFSSNKSNCEYFLGEGIDSVEKVTEKYGALKPCVHGSDAHSPAKICKPDGDRFTWIKADPSFEGLRQVIFEPKDRVHICKEDPQQKILRPYFSQIRIDSGQVFQAGQLEFTATDLELNPNLVCVIGGRGSGKSVLLGAIKRTFIKTNSENPDDKSGDIITKNFHVSFTKTDKKTEEYHISDENNLDYLHVSQGEVKQIVQNAERLDKQIKSMLGISDPGMSFYESQNIKKVLGRIAELKDAFKEVDNTGKLVHSKSYHEQEIKRFKELISTITTEKNREHIQTYCANVSELTRLSALRDELEVLSNDLNEFYSDTNKRIKLLNQKLNGIAIILESSSKDQQEQIKTAVKAIKVSESTLSTANRDITVKFKKAGIEGDITTLLQKVNQYQERIEWHEQNIRQVEEDLQELTELFKLLKEHSKAVKSQLVKYMEKLDASWLQLQQGKEGWTQDQKKLTVHLTNEIEVKGEIRFDVAKFYKQVNDAINKNKFKATKEESVEDRIRTFLGVKNKDTYFQLIENEKIIDVGNERLSLSQVLDEDYLVKDGEKSLLQTLFSPSQVHSYLKVICELKYRKKSPSQLSVGQRGTLFVCLKLATDTFGQPFVFDQPEDDLDNQFIMHELVPLFRDIKKYRQVIVVTHNANLVVNADAEQVIVAANDGEKLGYESGALENTKNTDPVLSGIRESVCDILEGGVEAFKRREQKYRIH